MYVPPPHAVDHTQIRSMVEAIGAAELVTTAADGYPVATLLPILWRGDTVVAHMARANPHWRELSDDQPALLVVTGPQAYVSPSWYAAKAEHGRVVPTWNYTSAHLTGRLTVHDDPEWLLHAVTDLTDRHEGHRAQPWAVDDAPAAFVAGQLRGIVGISMRVERVEGKAKLSQNRSTADRADVVHGLRQEGVPGAAAVARAMDADAT
ncbi:putative FMN-binding domain protein [Aeromicrobium marinum DSM 15272]|uniref:FMN-binding domain protein n=1 Tax=Aeromicrobium marinum DSM 15272 TaxID=585531 RepID=E2S7U4_9ACTN|nr:FMN-binding negative transcriptional regulator [Aeromicrobium marinum]EFQ84760.1 putative FMN-binding domain protein [Aeromicrobium marinum DSM 15272]